MIAIPWPLFTPRRPLRAAGGAAAPEPLAAPHTVLCVLPRRMPSNPLKPYLTGYDLASADNWSAAVRLARHKPHDLYIVCIPLGWADHTEICRRIRAFDQRTPLIVYSTLPSSKERREVLGTACVQAYVGRADDSHNLAGTAGQLIMLAELRSHDAMRRSARAIDDQIRERLANREPGVETPARMRARTKIEACRIFGDAGGTPANFERLWPYIYDQAVKGGPKR